MVAREIGWVWVDGHRFVGQACLGTARLVRMTRIDLICQGMGGRVGSYSAVTYCRCGLPRVGKV